MKEQQLLKKIGVAEVALSDAQKKLAQIKKNLTDAESVLIECKINLQNLQEELRIHRDTTPKHQLDYRDQEIETFRGKMKELLKKV